MATQISVMGAYMGEFVGTFILLLLGCGVVANVALKKSNGNGGGWIVITTGWGFAVAIAAYSVGWVSGAHLNPAVTIGLAAIGAFEWKLVPGYIVAQMIGAFLGAVVNYLAYKEQFDATEDAATKLGVFSTGPAVNNPLWNLITEIIGTFVLLFGILAITNANNNLGGMGTFLVGVLVWGIGLSLGGPTGYAINPARDLGPRIAHALLPLKNKGDSNWGYAWIPIVGPIIGGILGAVVYNICINGLWK